MELIFTPPQSKSDAQRALVLARIVGAAEPVLDPEPSSDVATLRNGLEVIARAGSEIDCGDGGAPFRFLLGQAAVLSRVPVVFLGSPRLGQRPHAALAAALPGVTLEKPEATAVGTVRIATVRPADQMPTSFSVASDESSQFASSVLLAAAAIAHRSSRVCTVRVDGARVSEGYLQMTLRWIRAAGFEVTEAPPFIPSLVEGSPTYLQTDLSSHDEPARMATRPSTTARDERRFSLSWKSAQPLPEIPGDWSSLGYLLLLAWATRGSVARMSDPSLHPDGAIVSALSSVGLTVHQNGTVSGALRGQLEVSALQCPDSIPTLAALACLLPAPSHFTDCEILRGKESDRVEGICALARAAGASTRLEGDTLTLLPGTRVRALRFDCHSDHRMAMSAATLAALAKVPLALRGMDCVKKSFPGFWTEFAKTRVQVERLS